MITQNPKLAILESFLSQDIKGSVEIPERQIQIAGLTFQDLLKVSFIILVGYLIINLLIGKK